MQNSTAVIDSNSICSAAELEGLEPPSAHPPCALSSSRMKRFNDRSQPSVASMFGKKRSAGDLADRERSATNPLKRRVHCNTTIVISS